ncbi:ParB/RepB/Spo0J family partition protein [Rikenella microfusus]
MKTNKKNLSNTATAAENNVNPNAAPVQAPASEPEQTAVQGETPKTMLDMTLIRTSPYNPRKSYDKQGIRELADTLKEVGLIQPIKVRVVKGYYEIVCGERRYHAAALLKWKQIEGCICDVSDEVARDMALTENLQREDMPPMDEAVAYMQLVQEGKDIYTLAARYGKSDRYIYDRLKLNDLIPEVADLLNRKMIGIGIALEISKCEKHIQKDLFERHLKGENGEDNDPTAGWRGKGVADFKEMLRQAYTTDLKNYHFDKTECRTCAHNTNTYDLFATDCTTCGRCTNAKCLQAKNDAFVLEKAHTLLKSDPHIIMGKSEYGGHSTIERKIGDEGHTVKKLGWNATDFPVEPTAPKKENYKKEEDFAAAQKRFEIAKKRYDKETAELTRKMEAGEVRVLVKAESHDAKLVYVPVNRREVEPDFVKRLTEQKAANLRKAFEKTVEDTRDLVRDNSEPAAPFSAFEENALYYVMLGTLKRKHYKLMDSKQNEYGHLSPEQKLAIVAKLTPEQKDIIRRDYIAAYLTEGYCDEISRKMLCEYAAMHYPDQFGLIKARHDETYENRNNRLDERIAEFKAKEKVRREQAAKKAAKEPENAEKAKPKTKKGGKAGAEQLPVAA